MKELFRIVQPERSIVVLDIVLRQQRLDFFTLRYRNIENRLSYLRPLPFFLEKSTYLLVDGDIRGTPLIPFRQWQRLFPDIRNVLDAIDRAIRFLVGRCGGYGTPRCSVQVLGQRLRYGLGLPKLWRSNCPESESGPIV
jgi:hypothetical protein